MHNSAIIATVAPAYHQVSEYAAYKSQDEAHLASVTANMRAAVAVIKEIAASPALLANTQVMSELDGRLDFLGRNEPEATADLRAAIATLGARPEAQQDPELVFWLEQVRELVAPLRAADCITLVDTTPTGSLLGDLANLLEQDTSGPEGATVTLPAYLEAITDA